MKTIGIIGTRRRNSDKDFDLCEKEFLRVYEDGDELVSGGCNQGGDKFCEIIAKKFSVPIKIYYANWKKYGKSAGFIRNTNIAEDADIIVALLPGDGSHSNGTEDTIFKAKKMGKTIVYVFDVIKVMTINPPEFVGKFPTPIDLPVIKKEDDFDPYSI